MRKAQVTSDITHETLLYILHVYNSIQLCPLLSLWVQRIMLLCHALVMQLLSVLFGVQVASQALATSITSAVNIHCSRAKYLSSSQARTSGILLHNIN